MEKEPTILYEDENVLVVNKPAGLVVHGDGRTKEATLADWVLEKYPEMKEIGEPFKKSDGVIIPRPGIVHRLDRDTSGVLILAKNQDTFLFLKTQFQNREVQKEYEAIVYGRVKEPKGVIDIPIGKSKKDFRQWLAHEDARGILREAVTEYQVINTGEKFTHIRIHPKTGRTHQIRVHMKALGNPIVCDSLYAKGRECALGLDRTALHAVKITFKLPDNKMVTVEAPFPQDFQNALKRVQNGDM